VPGAHLADGRLTLVLVRRCGWAAYLRFLLLLSRRGLEPGPGLPPFVSVLPASAVRVVAPPPPSTPSAAAASRRASVWNIDGELAAAGDVLASVDRGALRVFARGVEASKPEFFV
jgi:hypothetical protein